MYGCWWGRGLYRLRELPIHFSTIADKPFWRIREITSKRYSKSSPDADMHELSSFVQKTQVLLNLYSSTEKEVSDFDLIAWKKHGDDFTSAHSLCRRVDMDVHCCHNL